MHEVRKHAEFVARELHWRAVSRNPRQSGIQRDAVRTKLGRNGAARPANQRAQSCEYFLDAKRLCDVVVLHRRYPLYLLVPTPASRKHRCCQASSATAAPLRTSDEDECPQSQSPRACMAGDSSIIFSIFIPPVRKNRMSKAAVSTRKMMLSTLV